MDEWGTWYDPAPGHNPAFLYQQNTLRDALVAGVTLNIFNQHCDRVKMACIAQLANVLQSMVLTDGPKMTVTPSYWVFEMYTVHHDAKLLPTDLQSADYEFNSEKFPPSALQPHATNPEEFTSPFAISIPINLRKFPASWKGPMLKLFPAAFSQPPK